METKISFFIIHNNKNFQKWVNGKNSFKFYDFTNIQNKKYFYIDKSGK